MPGRHITDHIRALRKGAGRLHTDVCFLQLRADRRFSAQERARLEKRQDVVLRPSGSHHSRSRRSRSASRRKKSSASARSRSESWSAYRSSAPGALPTRGVSTLPMR